MSENATRSRNRSEVNETGRDRSSFKLLSSDLSCRIYRWWQRRYSNSITFTKTVSVRCFWILCQFLCFWEGPMTNNLPKTGSTDAPHLAKSFANVDHYGKHIPFVHSGSLHPESKYCDASCWSRGRKAIWPIIIETHQSKQFLIRFFRRQLKQLYNLLVRSLPSSVHCGPDFLVPELLFYSVLSQEMGSLKTIIAPVSHEIAMCVHWFDVMLNFFSTVRSSISRFGLKQSERFVGWVAPQS